MGQLQRPLFAGGDLALIPALFQRHGHDLGLFRKIEIDCALVIGDHTLQAIAHRRVHGELLHLLPGDSLALVIHQCDLGGLELCFSVADVAGAGLSLVAANQIDRAAQHVGLLGLQTVIAFRSRGTEAAGIHRQQPAVNGRAALDIQGAGAGKGDALAHQARPVLRHQPVLPPQEELAVLLHSQGRLALGSLYGQAREHQGPIAHGPDGLFRSLHPVHGQGDGLFPREHQLLLFQEIVRSILQGFQAAQGEIPAFHPLEPVRLVFPEVARQCFQILKALGFLRLGPLLTGQGIVTRLPKLLHMELQRVPLSAFQLLGRGQLRQLGYFFRKISRFLRRYAQGQHHAKGQSQRDDLFTVHSFSSFLCRISIPYSGEWDNRQSVNGRGWNLRVFLRSGYAAVQSQPQRKHPVLLLRGHMPLVFIDTSLHILEPIAMIFALAALGIVLRIGVFLLEQFLIPLPEVAFPGEEVAL